MGGVGGGEGDGGHLIGPVLHRDAAVEEKIPESTGWDETGKNTSAV